MATLAEQLGFIPWLFKAVMMFVMENIMPTFVKRKMFESQGLSGEALEKQLNSKIFGGMTMVKHMHEIHLIQSRVEAKEGGQVPELDLVEYFDKENTTLKEIMRPGVPLVLNFGSCS